MSERCRNVFLFFVCLSTILRNLPLPPLPHPSALLSPHWSRVRRVGGEGDAVTLGSARQTNLTAIIFLPTQVLSLSPPPAPGSGWGVLDFNLFYTHLQFVRCSLLSRPQLMYLVYVTYIRMCFPEVMRTFLCDMRLSRSENSHRLSRKAASPERSRPPPSPLLIWL